MKKAIELLFYFGPLVFAFGFLAPLFTQVIRLFEMPLPAGVTPLIAGLGLATILGAVGQ